MDFANWTHTWRASQLRRRALKLIAGARNLLWNRAERHRGDNDALLLLTDKFWEVYRGC